MELNEDRVREVQKLIAEHHLDAQIIWHKDRPVLSTKDAEEVHDIATGNVLKCLIMKDRKGTVVAVMAPGDVRIDVNKLERLAGLKKLTFMTEEEMIARLGLEPGSVDPLKLPQLVSKVFVERTMLDKGFVIGSAGSRYCGLRIKPSEIMKAVEATVLDLQ
jgi:prolyl-tRNA editing enzyme YbaK/EbsC (Cys-tRNA(Pro) deacylase)